MFDPSNASHSIGTVSRATGLTADTIRVWERRYGRPKPIRLASGHRRYSDAQLRWMQRVARALSLGVRAGVAVLASEAELDRLVGDAAPGEVEAEVAPLVEAVAARDRDGLERQLHHAYHAEGALRFFDRHLAPLLRVVGDRWASGDLDVRHEQFASEVSCALLRDWRLAARTTTEAGVLCALLEGERHAIGLHMAALTVSTHAVPTWVLAAPTGPDAIAERAATLGCTAVAVSVSSSSTGPTTTARLDALRAALRDDIALLVGGAGARRVACDLADLEVLDDCAALDRWLGRRHDRRPKR